MAGKDNFFKARMTDEQAQTLEVIVKEIQEKTPGATVTASSIARYAMERYIDDYKAERDGTAIIARILLKDFRADDFELLNNKLSKLSIEFDELGKENISIFLDDFIKIIFQAYINRM